MRCRSESQKDVPVALKVRAWRQAIILSIGPLGTNSLSDASPQSNNPWACYIFTMSGASDKARFYLEQSVPELHELAAKKIFSREEINSITKKRSDFEHKLNARGSRPSDYARYAEYEMNLETLRRKRVKRLGVKTTNHTGERRIFFVLDRATKKFQGDIALWMQYVNYARKQRSNKKVSQILTSVLRLHPTKAELWIYAANYALEDRGDITEARSYMQRGLRFCKKDERIWIEYARLEMIYISKVVGRRQILGLDDQRDQQEAENREEELNGDVVALPAITAEDIDPHQRPNADVDQEALEKLSASPALSGAIPTAIFDAAMKEFKDSHKLCYQFFDMVAEFPNLPCTAQILVHLTETMHAFAPGDPETLIRWIQQPVISTDVSSAGFPTNFGVSLDRIQTSFKRLESSFAALNILRPRIILEQQILEWLLSYLKYEGLDPDIRKVIVMTLRKMWSRFQSDIELDPSGREPEVSSIISKLQAEGIHKLAELARAWALRTWPDKSERFFQGTDT